MNMKNDQIKSYNDSTFRLSGFSNAPYSEIRDVARSISKKAFNNIDEFPYLYFTAGITESLNFLIPKQPITILDGEYRYLKLFSNVTEKETDHRFLSYPFSGNGTFISIPEDKPTILDCSYIFASDMSNQKTIPTNVDKVLFGLSKSHNLSDYRIGWILSKEKISNYHILQYEFDYSVNVNLFNILKNVELHIPNFLYIRYKDKLSELFSKNNVTENNTNLFGIKDNVRIPWYKLN